MAYRDDIVALNPTHYFPLDGTANLGNGLSTSLTVNGDAVYTGAAITEDTPSGCLEVNTGRVIMGNTADINQGSNLYQTRTVMLWFNSSDSASPTGVYEQGGGSNNFAIATGIARNIICQAADAGEYFLPKYAPAKENRTFFVVFTWERGTTTGGAGTRLRMWLNGVEQEVAIDSTHPSTAAFPSHTGDISIGNVVDSLKFENEGTLKYAARAKRVAHIAFFNDILLTQPQIQTLFEKGVLPEITVTSQAELDALANTNYTEKNLAIRIDVPGDIKLRADNITFNNNNIDIQYTGTGTLTWYNCNGANASTISSKNGGTITIVDDCIQMNTPGTLTNVNTPIVFTMQAGAYTFTNSTIGEVENLSAGEAALNLEGTAVPTLTATLGTIRLVVTLTITDIDSDAIRVMAWNADDIEAGPIYNYTQGTSHVIDVGTITKVRVIADKPGYYTRYVDYDISGSAAQQIVLTKSPNVDITTDISALVAATTVETVQGAGGFQILRTTLNGDFEITAAQWRRYHDYFYETEAALVLLGTTGNQGDQIYNTTVSGIQMLSPLMEVMVAGTSNVSTQAYVNTDEAKVVYPAYVYNPRNTDNVALSTTIVEPLVDYTIIEGIVKEARKWAEIAARNTEQ